MREVAILALIFALVVVIVALYQDRLPQLVAALAGGKSA